MEQSSVATLVGFSELEVEERISSRHRAKGREKICEAIKKLMCAKEKLPPKYEFNHLKTGLKLKEV
jgi:hypothetical protein